jgi:spoIIIJ-associated protein
MEYVEAEGQSIDDAIERALRELGVERDRVEIEIVENATRGIFGFGGRKAKVRATLRTPLNLDPETPEKSARQAPPIPEPDRPATKSAAPAASAPKPQVTSTQTIAPARRTSAPKAAVPTIDGKALDQAKQTLEDVVRLIGAEGHVEVVHEAEGPRLLIAGDTSGVLIGRRGQTLDALEYFINRTLSREEEGGAHLVVDSQDYRARRRTALVDLARRLGERARRRGKTVTLNPMSPRDRRIVHLALQDDPSLTTRSSGKGYFRKLLIIPNRERRGGKSPSLLK